MIGQTHDQEFGKAIRPPFADPVTYANEYDTTQKHSKHYYRKISRLANKVFLELHVLVHCTPQIYSAYILYKL